MFRDVMVMEVPLVLKADFYATATIIGGILFAALYWLSLPVLVISAVTFVVTLVLRLLASMARMAPAPSKWAENSSIQTCRQAIA